MYDLDVQSMLDKLKNIPDTVMLCSNPCFELWILLHYENVGVELSSDECVKRVLKMDRHYKKGELTLEVRQYLLSNVDAAVERVKKLSSFGFCFKSGISSGFHSSSIFQKARNLMSNGK